MSSSSIEKLIEKAIFVEEFDGASDALIELKAIDRDRAASVASDILRRELGDEYYQAFAFNILHGAAPTKALDHIEEFAQSANIQVFGAMLSSIAEDVGIASDSHVSKVVLRLRNAISLRSGNEMEKIARAKEFFDATYPDSTKLT